MGRAVTRKRRELISLIKDGGRQSIHIDSQVWERLKKLSTSAQWEQKSQQGKHANASRKTVTEILRKIEE